MFVGETRIPLLSYWRALSEQYIAFYLLSTPAKTYFQGSHFHCDGNVINRLQRRNEEKKKTETIFISLKKKKKKKHNKDRYFSLKLCVSNTIKTRREWTFYKGGV